MDFQAMIDTQQNILNILKGEVSELFRDHVYKMSITDFSPYDKYGTHHIAIRYEDSHNTLIGVSHNTLISIENDITYHDNNHPIEFQKFPSFQLDITDIILYIRKSEWLPKSNTGNALYRYQSIIGPYDRHTFYHFKDMPSLDERILCVNLINGSSLYIDITATKPIDIDLEFSILAYPILKKED